MLGMNPSSLLPSKIGIKVSPLPSLTERLLPDVTVVVTTRVSVVRVEVETVLLTGPVWLAWRPDKLTNTVETGAPHPVSLSVQVGPSCPPVLL